jgi:hypothetical protein
MHRINLDEKDRFFLTTCDSVVNSLSSELWSRLWHAGLLSVLYFLAAPSAQAAESQQPGTHEPSEEELVKQTQNPVADLISVPFQNNFNFEVGAKHNHQIYLLNIQPVIPIHITENWNLISRIIQPVIKPAVARSRHRERHGAWRHEPDLLFISGKAWRADLGCGSDVYVADGHRQATGKRQIQSRPGGSRVMTEHWGVWNSI